MQIFEVGNEFTILKGDKIAEPKFRIHLSKLIIEKYGTGPFTTNLITEILFFCRDYYVSEFETIIFNEKSYPFYKYIVWLHEQAINLKFSEHFKNLPEGINKSYIAKYRRILKMIIEQACCVDMASGEIIDFKFGQRIQPFIDDLLFLGEMLLSVTESIAEQEMIEDVTDIVFDENDLYVFCRRHHYEFVFNHIARKQEYDDPEYIIDNNGSTDFRNAILKSFNIEYDKVLHCAILVMEHFGLKYGDCICAERNGFLKDIQNYTESTSESIEKFLSGMTLTRKNKMSLLELLKKPQSLSKYLYRPFLIWTIDQKEYFVFGTASLYEAENSLCLNAIPWGKMPVEWEYIMSFKDYMNRKEDIHDKWLDDIVEKDIKSTGVIYQRSVKKLVTKTQTYPLEIKNLGEIDFIIVSPDTKKVFVADCKHLQGRYDMTNQKNDYYNFTNDKDRISYVTKMNQKTKWLTENKSVLQEHLQLKFNNPKLSLTEYIIEGVFFINTPTFYMYNSDLRIYTFEQVVDVITGKHVDPIFSCFVDEEDRSIFFSVKHPYFKKPKLIFYEDDDMDCEVDKYGYPIKK